MAQLAKLIDDFLAQEFEWSPVMASGLGLTEFDDRLDDLSADAFRRRDAEATRWREAFAAIPDADLDPAAQIDRDLAISVLRGREILADWEGWRRDPQAYSGPILQGVFGLFLHRLRARPDLATSARGSPRARAAGHRAGHGQPVGRAGAPAHPAAWRRGGEGRDPVPARAPARRHRARTRPRSTGRRGCRGRRRAGTVGHVPRRAGGACHGHLGAGRGAVFAPAPGTRGPAIRSPRAARRRAGPVRAARRRDARHRPDHRRCRGLGGGPRERERRSSGDRGGDAGRIRGMDGSRPDVPPRHGIGDDACRRALPGRTVAGVPATGPGSRVVCRPAGVLAVAARPFLRPVRARRDAGRGGPGAAGGQCVGQDPHDRGPRGVSRPPLAPHHPQDAAQPDPARLRDALFQRGLGPLLGAGHAGARLLRRAAPGAATT